MEGKRQPQECGESLTALIFIKEQLKCKFMAIARFSMSGGQATLIAF
jgi:hypothetical protein